MPTHREGKMTEIKMTPQQLQEKMNRQKKKDKQKKSKKKRKSTSLDEEETADISVDHDRSKDASSKPKKRSRRESSDTVETHASAADGGSDSSDNDNLSKSEKDEKKAMKKKSRREKRQALIAQLPKTDPEHGLKYSKQQLRRMAKRLERGLNPIETIAEQQERFRQDKELRKEEEAELADMIYENPKQDDDAEDEDQMDDEDIDSDDQQVDAFTKGQDTSSSKKVKNTENAADSSEAAPAAAAKKRKSTRAKPVPDDYVCSACQNQHTPAHWIYDCPDKITVRGTNKKSQRIKGLHEPDTKKVFVSGLPFDATRESVEAIFSENKIKGGKVVQCKLLQFEDSKRCKGQAYVMFDTDQAAISALKLNGILLDNVSDSPKKGSSDSTKRKSLKLKVSQAKSRFATKSKQGQGKK